MAGSQGGTEGAQARQGILLSTLPATASQKRLALWVVGVSAGLFAATVPFARVPLAPVWPFIPSYQAALIAFDVVTAALVFGQFAATRAPALLLLAGAYLFSALMALAHLFSFPGLFAPTGLLGAGSQTTAWIYFIWHGGFPLFLAGYAVLADRWGGKRAGAGWIAGTLCAVAFLAVGLTALATAGHDLLPVIMRGNQDDSAKILVASSTWLVSLLALGLLLRRRPMAVIDLWLAVVLCAWLFDIGLAAVFNAARFDLGFYAGRIYGLLAAGFVLVVLLFEIAALYGRLTANLARHAERLRLVHGIDRGIAGRRSMEEIARSVVQPLQVLLDVPRVIVNRFNLASGTVEWIAAAGRRRIHVGPGIRYSIGLMGDVEALRRGEMQRVDVSTLPPGPEVDALLASGVRVYAVAPMIAGGELLGALSYGGESDQFTPEQTSIAREVAAQLAIALSQAALLQQAVEHAAELETRVQQRTEELRAANKELESFSYSVSHDLRAPLRAVDGYARMLEEDYGAAFDDEGRRLLGAVRRNAARMSTLIDDLLRFSRLGRQPPAKAVFDMTGLVREIVEELRPADKTVELSALPSAPGDPALLKQVWLNLVGNALKYSAKSAAPHVEIGGRRDGSRAEYWVRDNGVGFDMRYASKLFGVFQRLHRAEEFEGTGVGLAIVQRVVSRHGGEVRAEAKPGEGACFTFTLPLEAAA